MGFGDFRLEGAVLRNSFGIMLRFIIPPILSALFPVASFLNTPKGLHLWQKNGPEKHKLVVGLF